MVLNEGQIVEYITLLWCLPMEVFFLSFKNWDVKTLDFEQPKLKMFEVCIVNNKRLF